MLLHSKSAGNHFPTLPCLTFWGHYKERCQQFFHTIGLNVIFIKESDIIPPREMGVFFLTFFRPLCPKTSSGRMKGDFFSLLEEMLLINLQIIAHNTLVNHGTEKDENIVVFHDGEQGNPNQNVISGTRE